MYSQTNLQGDSKSPTMYNVLFTTSTFLIQSSKIVESICAKIFEEVYFIILEIFGEKNETSFFKVNTYFDCGDVNTPPNMISVPNKHNERT